MPRRQHRATMGRLLEWDPLLLPKPVIKERVEYDIDGGLAMSGGDPACVGRPLQKAAEVFAIPEILEQILLNVPSTDALIAQRVSTAWRDVIQGSTCLQRSFFLRLRPDPPIICIYDKRDFDWYEFQEIRHAEESGDMLRITHYAKESLPRNNLYYSHILVLNPLVCTSADSETSFSLEVRFMEFRRDTLSRLFEDCYFEPFSCKYMHLAKPPPRAVQIILRCPPRQPDPMVKCFAHASIHNQPIEKSYPSVVTPYCSRHFCKSCMRKFLRTSSACVACAAPLAFKDLFTYKEKNYTLDMVRKEGGVKVMDVIEAMRWWYWKTQHELPEPWRAIADKVTLKFTNDVDDEYCGGYVPHHEERWESALKTVNEKK